MNAAGRLILSGNAVTRAHRAGLNIEVHIPEGRLAVHPLAQVNFPAFPFGAKDANTPVVAHDPERTRIVRGNHGVVEVGRLHQIQEITGRAEKCNDQSWQNNKRSNIERETIQEWSIAPHTIDRIEAVLKIAEQIGGRVDHKDRADARHQVCALQYLIQDGHEFAGF